MPWDIKAHRERLKAKGICVRCHRDPAVTGRVLCLGCKRDRLANLVRLRKQWRATHGKCSMCGNPTSGWKCCDRCRATRRASVYRIRAKWLAEGRCRDCGAMMPPDPGFIRCAKCCESATLAYQTRRACGKVSAP